MGSLNASFNTSLNLSLHSDETTARTRPECAAARAAHLSSLGVSHVLELCVGPSLQTMARAYAAHGIACTGNDIEIRWKHYYPEGNWIIGDALQVVASSQSLSHSISLCDAIVFAPPLSKGCSGQREDALMIDDVFPRYIDFLNAIEPHYKHYKCRPKGRLYSCLVLVLPARALATSWDRRQFHALLASCRRKWPQRRLEYYEIVNHEGVRNYVDIYIY